MKKRTWITGILVSFVGLFIISNVAIAGDYPTRPVELIIAYGSGGSSSMAGRIVAGKAGEVLGEPLVVINKPGAGGTLAGRYAANAKPDGYTLFVFSSGSNGVSPAIRTNIGYKNSDFDLIGQFAVQNIAVVVRKDAQWQTLTELVDYAKANPGKLKCATVGVGSSSHFGLELFKLQAGDLQIDSVPAKGGGEMNQLLLGGHVHLATHYVAGFKGAYDAGKIRMLAMFSHKRDPSFPDVPTFTELGIPNVFVMGWYGIAVPKGLDPVILAKLRKDFDKILADAEVQKMLGRLGFTPTFRNAEDFATFEKNMAAMYRRVVKEANIQIK
jgi:tripartite-type tricarboxylate transporter receptor subunit TctC